MFRAVLLPLVILGGLLLADVAQPQIDFKPRPGTTPATPPTPPPSRSGSGRYRPSERIAIGERAPDFELTRLDGKPLRLSALRGEWVMLFFVERRDSLQGVEPVAVALAGVGVRTVAVVYDKVHVLGRHLHGHEVHYIPLADPTGDIVALYGLWNHEADGSLPGFVLVNPRGEVRLALLGQSLPAMDASRLVEYAVVGE